MGNCSSLELENLAMNGMPVAVWLIKHYTCYDKLNADDRKVYDNIMMSFLSDFTKETSPINKKE